MSLDDFVEKANSAALVRRNYQEQVAQKEEERKQVEAAARAHPGIFTEKQIENGAYGTPEGLTHWHKTIELANMEMFRQNAQMYVGELDDEKLKERAVSIRPAESADEKHYETHKRAYDIAQAIARREQNGDAKSAKRIDEIEKEYISHEVQNAREEVLGKLKGDKKGNYLGISDEEVEEWVERVAKIQERVIKSGLERLREKDALAPARYILHEAQREFYETFDEKDRDKKIADYVRQNILDLSREGDEEERKRNIGEAIEYVRALAA